MTRAEAVNKLTQAGIDHGADYLADALRYVFNTAAYIQRAELHCYACECKRCDLTHYTSYKRLNCEFCGCDSDQFTCRELK